MTEKGRQPFHPVAVSKQGYPMLKEPWRKTKYYLGFGMCCYDQQVPDTCEHDRNPGAYKHLRIEPKKGATHDVYGYLLPLPPPRTTFEPS